MSIFVCNFFSTQGIQPTFNQKESNAIYIYSILKARLLYVTLHSMVAYSIRSFWTVWKANSWPDMGFDTLNSMMPPITLQ